MLLDKHGKTDLEIAKKKIRNYKSDLEQFNKLSDDYKKENKIKSFDDYQDMKYKKKE